MATEFAEGCRVLASSIRDRANSTLKALSRYLPLPNQNGTITVDRVMKREILVGSFNLANGAA